MKFASTRLAIAALVFALIMPSAHAQIGDMGIGDAHRDRRAKTGKTDAQKPKVDEKAYEAALKSVPVKQQKQSDPWQGVR